MELQFLFLPFTGVRDKNGNLYAVGSKYTRPALIKRCDACVYTRRIEYLAYNETGSQRDRRVSHECSKNITTYRGIPYEFKHPCAYFIERYKLKKL